MKKLLSKISYMNGLEGYERFKLFRCGKFVVFTDTKLNHSIWELSNIKKALISFSHIS